MQFFAWLLEITSLLIVGSVTVEYYTKEYRFQRSNVTVRPHSNECSTLRQNASAAWPDFTIEHALTISNAGDRSCVLSTPTVSSITLTSEDGDRHRLDDCQIRSRVITRDLPDGKRIPPQHSGPLSLATEIGDQTVLSDHLRPGSLLTVELELAFSDNTGSHTLSVRDRIPVYGSRERRVQSTATPDSA